MGLPLSSLSPGVPLLRSFLCNLGRYYQKEVGTCFVGEEAEQSTQLHKNNSHPLQCWLLGNPALDSFGFAVALDFHGNYQVAGSIGMLKFFHYFKESLLSSLSTFTWWFLWKLGGNSQNKKEANSGHFSRSSVHARSERKSQKNGGNGPTA